MMKFFKRRKSPIWPALLSALVAPGVGQFANREYQKGFFLLLAFITSFLWFSKAVTERLSLLLPGTPDQWVLDQPRMKEALTKLVGDNVSMFFTFQILMLLIWGFSVLDAYFTARKLALLPVPPDEDKSDLH